MNKNLNIGFIGLGLMGNPMARNILKAGFPLTVYNRTKSKTKELVTLGATVADTPKELAQHVDIVISMITAPKDVEEVYLGKNGVAQSDNKRLIAIDMSTIGPHAAKDIATQLKAYNIDFLDAPVTGSVPKAISGELTIFIGGDETIYKKVKPVLQAMGTNLQYMGPVGNGQAIKLINNMLIAISVTGFAEGMLLADTLGLSRKRVTEALSNVPLMSPYMLMKLPNFVTNTFPTAFSLSNMRKDVTLAKKETQTTTLPLLAKTQQLFTKGLKDFGDEDLSAIIKVLQKKQ